MWHNKDFRFGITNQGDAGLDFKWVQHMPVVIGAIVISKAANEQLKDALIENRSKVIYHATCTGLGGSKLEPNVPTVEEKFKHLKSLIESGFPREQIVVRIDPLLPKIWIDSVNGLLKMNYMLKLENILRMTEMLGIKRVRYSYLKVNDSVLAMLQNLSDIFVLPKNWEADYRDEIQLPLMNKSLKYESCSEYYVPYAHQIGCISNEDLKILGLGIKYECDCQKTDQNKNHQWCKCPINKLELLPNFPFECGFECKYCYWRRVNLDSSSKTKIYGKFK